jgi:VLRF1 release factor-like protein
VKNVAGSGGKWLDISAERFPGWIASFSVRHGVSDASGAAEAGQRAGAAQSPTGPGAALTVTFGDDLASFTAEDGSVAECYPPFPPPGGASLLAANAGADSGTDPARPATPAEVAAIAEAFAAHARRPRTVGVLLVRLGGYAAGVFAGYPPVLQDAKVGSRLVHGRSAAGGWSQHRFARRREKQANEALDAAADAAVLIFGKRITTDRSKGRITARSGGAAANPGAAANRRPQPPTTGRPAGQPTPARLDAVVLGGDRRAVAELKDDPRLAPYFQLAVERFLTVPDPKRAVLLETPRLFTAVRIRLTEA